LVNASVSQPLQWGFLDVPHPPNHYDVNFSRGEDTILEVDKPKWQIICQTPISLPCSGGIPI
jgi:hypothetical protein